MGYRTVERVVGVVGAIALSCIFASCGSNQPDVQIRGQLGTYGAGAKNQALFPQPLPGKVTATAADGRKYSTNVPASGQFRLNVPQGSYILTGSSSSDAGNHAPCSYRDGTLVVGVGGKTGVLVECGA